MAFITTKFSSWMEISRAYVVNHLTTGCEEQAFCVGIYVAAAPSAG